MKDDPIRLELLTELRALRRGTGSFGIDRVALSEMLTEFVGRGSVEQAYTKLLDALRRDGGDAESDVRAYFQTAGYEVEGNNLDERLKAYAATHFVDERTGLRRSDRGAERLSFVLRDEFNYERPWANIFVVQDGAFAELSVSVHLPDHALWRRPIIYLNDELQDRREFELHDSDVVPGFVAGFERFPRHPLRLEAGEDDPLLEVRVYWVPDVWPTWQCGVQLTDPRLYVKLANNRDYSAELSIHWVSVEAAASRDHPLVPYRYGLGIPEDPLTE